ncbi:MAG: proline--tRNA ligase [Actinomycetota bacterium]|nr:proline--tRNA ligase [Actinomycetota bacterium]
MDAAGKKKPDKGVTPQSTDFSAWYNEVVLRAELADRGPVKGTMVIRPYGYRIWELLQAELDARIKATGHQNAYFPLLIPENHLRREAEHVEGFSPELAVVTIGGGKKLDEPLVVRPTSESIIGEMFSRWISSHRDLPLLLNQWANVVRWELRPRLFLRTTEFLWQEGHTAHTSEDDAMGETMVALRFYEDVARNVAAMPVIPGEKTPGERFAGAARTFTIEAMMRDSRALQAGTSHYMGQNFAKAFDIRYTSDAGAVEYCHTTSWGMSTRMIGGIIMTHGDDKGLVLPPKLAPYQAVVVPIGRADSLEASVREGDALVSRMEAGGIRAHLDRRSVSPGFKFNDWEMRGVPLRLELGPRDLAAGLVTVANRLTGDKDQVPLESVESAVRNLLAEIQDEMLAAATQFQDDRTSSVSDWTTFAARVSSGFALALHCGERACEEQIKVATTATARCVPLSAPAEDGQCVRCGNPAAYGRRVLFGRAY